MRVLHVISHFALGGAERVAETLASRMARDGTASALFAVAASEPTFADEFRRRVTRAGGIHFAGSRHRSAKYASGVSALALVRTLREFDPDVVHLHTEIPEYTWAIAALWSTEARQRPVVRTIHNAILWPGWKKLGRFAERNLYRAKVVAASAAAADAFALWTRGRPSESPTLIYNGVEWPSSVGLRRLHHRPRLLFAGRFEPQKGVDVLLAAMEHLATEDFHLSLLGSGSLEAEVARKVANDPRMTVGPPDPELREHLDQFDAVLMPSRFEGLPLLAIEAAGSGLPLIATQAVGLHEVLPSDYPDRATPGNAASFAEAIRSFLRRPERLRVAAEQTRAGVRERFGIDRMASEYLAVYESARHKLQDSYSFHP